MLILDCEIKNLLLKNKKEVPKEGYVYARNWNDYLGMGISVVGGYSYTLKEYYHFSENCLSVLQRLIDSHDLIVGFNILNFDWKLLEAFSVQIPRDKIYDIYLEIKRAADAGKYDKGFNLKNLAIVNNISQKSGDGAIAPEMWQQGKQKEVIDYCLQDVKVTKELLDLIMEGKLRDPRNPARILNVEKPFEDDILCYIPEEDADGEPITEEEEEDDYDDSKSTSKIEGDDDEDNNS